MKQQDNRETNNESIIIEGITEDLSAPHAEEIKGGPTKPAGGGGGGDIVVWDIVDS